MEPTAVRGVEVKHQGEWGTVDDLDLTLKDASVVCRQLGCGAAIGFPGGAYFGPGLGPIWLLYTSCKGVESTVSDCRHSNIKDYRNDSHSQDEDAGVVCSGKSCLVCMGISSRKSLSYYQNDSRLRIQPLEHTWVKGLCDVSQEAEVRSKVSYRFSFWI